MAAMVTGTRCNLLFLLVAVLACPLLCSSLTVRSRASVRGGIPQGSLAKLPHSGRILERDHLADDTKWWWPLRPRRFGSTYPGTGRFIFYHNGPVLTTVNVYVIYYGNWSAASTSLIETFISDLNGPATSSSGVATVGGWWAITTKYFSRVGGFFGQQSFVGSTVNLKGVTVDNLSLGSKGLADSDILKIVDKAISSKSLPYDANGIYAVLSDPSVSVDGFCSSFCGYHNYQPLSNRKNAIYLFAGDASQCPTVCSVQRNSPNGNLGVDALINILAHEIAEAATDPALNGWYNVIGYENADMCAWQFSPKALIGKSYYNMVGQSGKKYLIQQNFDRATLSCKLGL